MLGLYNPFWGKMQWAGIWYPLYGFQNFQYKISDKGHNKFEIDLLEANECSIYDCVKTYNVSIREGKAYEDVIASWHNESMPQERSGSIVYPRYLNPPNSSHNLNHSGPYMMNGEAQDSINGFVSGKFQGIVAVDTAKNVAWDGNGDPRWIYAEGNVSLVLENVALAVTDEMQTSQPNRLEIYGQQISDEIYVQIRWEWLTLPVLVVVLSAAFLLQTMYATYSCGARVWKSSNLVLLYHGLEFPPASEEYPLDELSQMDRVAKVHKVRLRRDDAWAWKLVDSRTTHT